MGASWIYRLPPGLVLTLFVLVFVGGTGAGLWLTRSWFRPSVRPHNELAGFIYAVIGVIYAVLLGMSAVAAWDDYQALKRTSEFEAHALGDLTNGLAGYPPAARERYGRLAATYMESVITHEWPAMQRGEPSRQTEDAARALVSEWVRFQPTTMGEAALFEQSLSQLDRFLTQRRLRLNAVREGLEPLMWGVLLFGAVITIGFSYLFLAENLALHALMTCCLAALIGAIIFWIVAFDHPLWGAKRITPDAFAETLKGVQPLQRETAPR